MTEPAPLLTVGHSDHEPEIFLALLRGAEVGQLIDVRRYPGSRRHPHFSRDALRHWLPEGRVAYRFAGDDLGGMRTAAADSPHEALRGDPTQAYADHMLTEEFRRALHRVVVTAGGRRTAVMCAEASPDRCHRRFLADAVELLHDVPVLHLGPDGALTRHRVHPSARRDGDRVVYDLGVDRPLFA